MESKKNILIAPLNWGLGHATRCIPIINKLQEHGYNPILASDGVALELLKKEFPHLITIPIPSYKIEYAKKGKFFKVKLFLQLHKIIKAIFLEYRAVAKIYKQYSISGIISDNRLGVMHSKVPSIFITHQLNVLTGKTTWITTKLHQFFITRFNECWVPDIKDNPNLSGKLGHLDKTNLNLKYIGPLSRLEKKELPIRYDLMVILSGPEPQRTMLEEILLNQLQSYKGKILFIKGKIETQQQITQNDSFTIYNFMTSKELERAFNESRIILCRSGYTTVMDIAQLGKKAFFIPTPGQYEQKYLAKKFKYESIAPSCKQENFHINRLAETELYKGFINFNTEMNWNELFSIFEKKSK